MSPTTSDGGKLVVIHEYVATMRARAEALRARSETLLAPSSAAGAHLATVEALQELETAHEELKVADEELRAQSEELERVRQRLAGELRRFHDLFDHSPDGYVESDMRGVVRLGNRTIAARLNVPPEFLQQKPLIHFVVRGDCECFRSALTELQSGRTVNGVALRLRPRGRKAPFFVDARACPVTGLGSRSVAIRWALRVVASFDEAASCAISSMDALVRALVSQSNAAILGQRLRLTFELNARRQVSPETASAWFPILSAALRVEVAAATAGAELRVAVDDAAEGVAWRLGGALLLLPIRAT